METEKIEEISVVDETYDISIADIPTFIEARFREMNEIQKHISEGEILSKTIESSAQAAMKSAEQSVIAANEIKDSHMTAPTFGHKKEAIIEVQNKLVDVAKVEIAQAGTISQMGETLQVTAAAQLNAAKSNSLIVENQKRIVQISRAMIAIGTKSIAMNRSILSELEMKLQNASEEELKTFEMQQIESVILELKQQQDIMLKQEKLEGVVHEHEERLNLKDESDSYINERVSRNEKVNDAQDKALTEQRKKDLVHDKRLDEGDKKDKEQDELIQKGIKKDTEQDQLIQEGIKKDNAQDEELKRQSVVDKEHDAILERHEKLIIEMRKQLEILTLENKQLRRQLRKSRVSRK